MKKLTFLLLLTFLGVSSVSAAAYQNLYVVGDACTSGWDPGAALQMTTTTDGVFTWTGRLTGNATSGARFKFLTARAWETSITCQIATAGHKVIASGIAEDLFVKTNTGEDNAFKVPETADYTVVVDLNTMKMTCTIVGVIDTSVPDLTQLNIVGDATTAGWDAANALTMVKVADGVFNWAGNLTVGGEFKFVNIKGSFARTINPLDANTDFIVGIEYSLNYRELESSPNDFKYKVTTAGLYSITVNMNTMKMNINTTGPNLSQLYIVGNATSADWANEKALEMTKQQDGVFSWTGELIADGEFKFINEIGKWSNTFNPLDANTTFVVGTEYNLNFRPMESSPNDFKFKATTAGRYTVSVNLNTMKVTVVASTEAGTGKVSVNDFSKKILVNEKTVRIVPNDNDKIQIASIYDITGKCLNSVSNIKNTVVLGDNLGNGVYIVKVNSDNKDYVQKVVIK